MYTFKIYDVCIAFNTPLALQKRSKGVASDARVKETTVLKSRVKLTRKIRDVEVLCT